MSCQPTDDGCTIKLSPLKPVATMPAYKLPEKCGLTMRRLRQRSVRVLVEIVRDRDNLPREQPDEEDAARERLALGETSLSRSEREPAAGPACGRGVPPSTSLPRWAAKEPPWCLHRGAPGAFWSATRSLHTSIWKPLRVACPGGYVLGRGRVGAVGCTRRDS